MTQLILTTKNNKTNSTKDNITVNLAPMTKEVNDGGIEYEDTHVQ